MRKIKNYNLYLVTGEEYSSNRTTLEIVTAAINAGVTIVQMREKKKSFEELKKLGAALKCVCRENNVLFIVNDDIFLAKAIDADGVHLGEEDIKKYPLNIAREILGDDKIIGVSTHSIEEALRVSPMPEVDYIAFGPLFYTKTKNYSIGINDVREVSLKSAKPVVFIGGIDLDNIDLVLARGAKNIAVIRAITEAEDVEGKVKLLKNKIKQYENKN
ncbi:thiamine-phosphate pyrophosphorylase [Candidatus Omnitrophus magneticus]|uniref:Thiamine-phosphate synthase n=1 Tax=Candidatus Omnitrophus magneticus TaxID=1609969 RepID=A0A0F0CX71_9BACT|nr:thiamine-phosphate pyrophosphorylase [Candidatus Omnitrophus magneticus]